MGSDSASHLPDDAVKAGFDTEPTAIDSAV